MPRQARQRSETGIYHIMKRGINRQDIFHDDEDRIAYLERLSDYKNSCGYKIYAYCLMDNHVHLLLKEGTVNISSIMKRIGASYVYWYNWKYGRTGPLFQDRYKSEPINDDEYFLKVLRYIHQNPVKIGLSIDNWTSYNDYISNNGITDVEEIFSLFSENSDIARDEFTKYMSESNNDVCLDISERIRVTDEEAKEIVRKAGLLSCHDLKEMEKQKRDMILKDLKESGLSIRQIERISGVNRGAILKA